MRAESKTKLGWRLLAALMAVASCMTAVHAEPRATREPAGGALFYEGYTFRDNTEAVHNPHILAPLFQLYWPQI